MFVTDLALTRFRNYASVAIGFEAGVNVLIGANGQGKTNMVEAIGYLSTLRSHRSGSDTPLIQSGASSAVIGARLESQGRTLTLECELNLRGANRAKVNGSPRKPRELVGICHTVTFAPEDLAIVKGDPDIRRSLLDDLVIQLTPRLAQVRTDYERILKQRTALLKSASTRFGGSRNADQLRTLDTWDAHLAQAGSRLLLARMELTELLRPYVASAYLEICGLPPGSPAARAGITYRSSVAAALGQEGASLPTLGVLGAQFADALAQRRSQEIERGQCLTGPHRDDLLLQLGDLPAKGYASHGESWSLALALKIASFRLLSDQDMGDGRPILILDDVFAELDGSRRAKLAAIAAGAEQTFITAATVSDVPESLAGARFDVTGGEIDRVR